MYVPITVVVCIHRSDISPVQMSGFLLTKNLSSVVLVDTTLKNHSERGYVLGYSDLS